jgi:hypothetical protein
VVEFTGCLGLECGTELGMSRLVARSSLRDGLALRGIEVLVDVLFELLAEFGQSGFQAAAQGHFGRVVLA